MHTHPVHYYLLNVFTYVAYNDMHETQYRIETCTMFIDHIQYNRASIIIQYYCKTVCLHNPIQMYCHAAVHTSPSITHLSTDPVECSHCMGFGVIISYVFTWHLAMCNHTYLCIHGAGVSPFMDSVLL